MGAIIYNDIKNIKVFMNEDSLVILMKLYVLLSKFGQTCFYGLIFYMINWYYFPFQLNFITLIFKIYKFSNYSLNYSDFIYFESNMLFIYLIFMLISFPITF
jgi:hypothetical protein